MRLRLVPAATLLVLLAAAADVANAQHPVCPSPAKGEVLHASCRSWAAAAAVRLLDDFTVDHLLKPALPPFERSWTQLATAFASPNLSEGEAFRALARNLDPLKFTQLDRTTGTVMSDLASSPREIEVTSEQFGPPARLRLRLPEVLEGGYWRGPDVVQVAFWQNHRPAVRAEVNGVSIADGEIRCIALSPDGLLVRFAEEGSAAVFVQLRDCAP